MSIRPAAERDTTAQEDGESTTRGVREVGYNAGLSRRRSRVRAPSAPLRCPRTEDLSPTRGAPAEEPIAERPGERVRLATIIALADAFQAQLKITARWSPGVVRELLTPGSMPACMRVEQLLGGER